MRTYLSTLAYYALLVAIGSTGLWSCEDPEAPVLPPTVSEEAARTKPSSTNARVANDFFPIAWYTGVEFINDLPAIKASGANTVIPYINLENQSLDDLEAYLDRAHELEMKVCITFPRLPRDWIRRLTFASTVPGKPNARPGATREINAYVSRFKDHPALLSWYMYDEPNGVDGMGISPVATELGYDLIKQEDPNHPISMVFNELPGTEAVPGSFEERHLDALDILMFDYYPALESAPEFGGPRWPNFTSFVERGGTLAAERQVPYWSVIQASQSANLGFRFPTEAEERYMLYTSIVSDATGIFFYTYSRFRNGGTEWIDDVLTPLVDEFKPIIPAITTGALNTEGNEAIVRDENTSGLELRYRLFQDPDTDLFYLVVVNQSDQSGPATIGLQPGQEITEIKDRRTDQPLSFTNEGTNAAPDYVFQDTLAPYAAVVYELTAAPPVAGEGTVTIRAQGDCGSEVMELHVDGTKVDEWTVSTTPDDYTYSGFGDGEVSVHFVNDSFDNGGACNDNNLTVDYIDVCGTTYPTEDAATKSTDCCPWDPTKLYNDGNFSFGTLTCDGATGSSPGGDVVIRAQGSQGDEQMRLLVDGQLVKTWTSVSADPADYRYDNYTGGAISVRFDNDAGSGSTDRNLGLDYLEVCGTRYEAESATRSVVEGCQATFTPWAWLWCNGEFAFGDLTCSAS